MKDTSRVLLAMMQDPRYFDLGPMIREAGITWDHLKAYLGAWTNHPFSRTFSEQARNHDGDTEINQLIDSYGCNIVIYDYHRLAGRPPRGDSYLESLASTTIYLRFDVHIGAVEFFCEYLGLKKISTHEAAMKNLSSESLKTLLRPYIKKTDVEISTTLDLLKKLHSDGSKIACKKTADRYKMFAKIIDNDQEMTRKCLAQA